MGELTARNEEIIRVPENLSFMDFFFRSVQILGTLLWKNSVRTALPDCPECVARKRKTIMTKQATAGESETPIEPVVSLEGEFPMKFDPATRHFICKKCGLYATREQISDIRDRLNQREKTREDRQYDYLEWWQKSKKDKHQR